MGSALSNRRIKKKEAMLCCRINQEQSAGGQCMPSLMNFQIKQLNFIAMKGMGVQKAKYNEISSGPAD